MAQGFAQPVHLGSMVEQVPHAIRDYGAGEPGARRRDRHERSAPGGVHLNDVTLISPVFVEGELLGYVANLAHHVDVGGGAPAQHRRFQEVFQEGVIIPPVGSSRAAQIVDDVFRLILAQIRSKHETGRRLPRPDRRQPTGVRRSQALVAQHGRETILATIDELLAYTERRTRAEIAALAARRRTRPRARRQRRLHRRARAPPARGSRSARTASASTSPARDPQRRAPVNSTYAMTFSACAYALKCLIDPDLPVNDGFYRLVHLDAPAGSVTNCTWPAAGRRRLGDADAARRGACSVRSCRRFRTAPAPAPRG